MSFSQFWANKPSWETDFWDQSRIQDEYKKYLKQVKEENDAERKRQEEIERQ